jgi:hypothetical protein
VPCELGDTHEERELLIVERGPPSRDGRKPSRFGAASKGQPSTAELIREAQSPRADAAGFDIRDTFRFSRRNDRRVNVPDFPSAAVFVLEFAMRHERRM